MNHNLKILNIFVEIERSVKKLEDDHTSNIDDLTDSITLLEKQATDKIDKEIKKIELEFMVLNADVRNEMKTKETSLKKNIDQTKGIIGDIDQLIVKNDALEQTQQQMTSTIAQQSSKLSTLSSHMTDRNEEISRKILSLNVSTTELALKNTAVTKTLSELNDEIDAEAMERNNMKLKMADESGKLLRLDDKFNHFEREANEHIHTTIENRLNVLEGADHKYTSTTRKVRYFLLN